MTTVVNHTGRMPKHPEGDYVFIGRPSKWGNPHPTMGTCPVCKFQHSHHNAIQAFQVYWSAPEQARLREEALRELVNKRLGCPGTRCTPDSCHGRIIADYVNRHAR